MKVSDWTIVDGAAVRYAGTDPDNVNSRVAVIEKTPRVRIRPFYLGQTSENGRNWPEFLDWSEGPKGNGPDDEASRAWCDKMLIALGYEL